ncbi:MAG TPA: tetratricopeptide repeat protein [Anaerolineales bacterium]|nr:tetratricopeptide repeat protein [Anaerolineales bacterium]
MSSIPSGTVTFLFTDIEGSTKLAQEHPDRWESLRERHHSILREAFETNHGFVFQIIGDAFCVAFHTVADGLIAAVEAQQGLQREEWGESTIKVRMGLHTGSAELHGNDYRGYLTMAKVQRIMSVAYGGQVLLSNTSAELLHNELPKDISLLDRKEHRLKGLPHPEHLWQVVTPDLQQDFPPLQSLKEIPNNLPVRLTTVIGRENEVEQVKKMLEKNRLVTLTGSGGVGKTRLSLQVASEILDEYPNGIWLVELAPVTDPALVTQAVCNALDIRPQGKIDALTVLTDYLRAKKMLLVIDNCEHLINASAQLSEMLLHTCRNIKLLASSREALGIEGESPYRVPSLSLADSNSGLRIIEQSEAVQLFVERAKTILPGYALTETNASTIAQICQRLEGIALAIELAASRVKLLKVEQIKERLDDTFRLLTGGSRTALPRQQTLRGTIDWSYKLLSEEERRVLRSLSMFVGGWTLDAAEFICDSANMLDLLTHLVDKSLVAVDREHIYEPRYYLLETIRQYAREKLAESGEGERIRGRHLDYFLKLAQRAEPELYGAGQIEWSQKLEDEHENLRAALEWSLQEDISKGQQLTAALLESWVLNGHPSEGYEWLNKMLAMNPEEKTLVRAKLLSGAGWLAFWLSLGEQIVERFCDASIVLFRQLGDDQSAAFPITTLAHLARARSDYDQAFALLGESRELFRKAGNKWGVRHVLLNLGSTAEAQENYEQAQKFYEESLLLAKEIGDKEGFGVALIGIGRLAEKLGEDERAMELYQEALQIEKAVKSKITISWILRYLGLMYIRLGKYEEAEALLEEDIEICRKMGTQAYLAYSLQALGMIACYQENYRRARSLFAESLQLLLPLGSKVDIAECIISIGRFLGAQGSWERFARLLSAAEGAVPDIKKKTFPLFNRETEKHVTDARAVLGEETYASAYEAGQQMNLDEAVAWAWKELGE